MRTAQFYFKKLWRLKEEMPSYFVASANKNVLEVKEEYLIDYCSGWDELYCSRGRGMS
jgi:hypothetical protein